MIVAAVWTERLLARLPGVAVFPPHKRYRAAGIILTGAACDMIAGDHDIQVAVFIHVGNKNAMTVLLSVWIAGFGGLAQVG